MRFKDVKGENFFINDIEGFNHYQLFLSNDLTLLASELNKNFFRKEGSFFREKIVLTASAATQFWLERELAKPISFNTHFYSFSRGMMEIYSRVFPFDKRLPNRLETLILLAENFPHICTNVFVQDLASAIFTFAQLFEKYALYEEKIRALHTKNFQAELYRRLYQSPFVSLAEWLKQKIKKSNIEVHLFALPHLPPSIFDFFCQLKNTVPCFIYQLNVCKEFWSDLLSQQELFFLEQKWQKAKVAEDVIQAFYDFSEAPLVLANYGKLMREGLRLWEDVVDQNEEYVCQKKEEQLASYQSAFLNFETEKKKKDSSLQFHVASSIIREIEVTKSLLFHLIFREKIHPKEIKILAPQFSEYSALLRAELADFPMMILHEQNLMPNSSLEGLLLLLKLEENRFTKEAILELFSYPSFAKKNGLTPDDINEITNWIESLHIRFGFNEKQKNRLLKTTDHPQIDASNTFEQGLHRLVRSIANEELVTLTNIELVAKFYDLVQEIYDSTKLFFENSKLPVGKILDQTKWIFEHFFVAEENFEELIHSLLPDFREKEISFSLFLRYLEERIRKRVFFENPKGLNHIFCTSLLLGSQLPCKVAIVLGMHLNAFPTKEISSSYDLLLEEEGYFPSNLDFEKNSFLELLNSCSSKLIFTFIKTPSLFLQELEDDLGEVTTYIHPPSCTDQSYFESKDPYYSSIVEKKEVRIQSVEKVESKEKKKEILVEDLIRFVKAPLFPFFRKQGLYFKDRQDEEFFLSPLTKAIIVRKKEVIKQIDQLKKEGAFPFHGFGEIAEQAVMRGRKELEEIFLYHQINDLSSLYLTDHQADSQYFYHKPLVLQDRVLSGQLSGITPKGIFLFERANFEGIIRALPALAILQITKVTEAHLLFGKEQKEKKISFSDPKAFLENLAHLYDEAHLAPLFLYPEFISPLLDKDIKKLQSKIDELCWREFDPYLSFMSNSQKLPTAAEVMESLYEKVKNCFLEIKDDHF